MSTTYKKLIHTFTVGQTLTNDNGRDYKVVSINYSDKVLFERVSDGEQVLATCPRMFEKTENGITSIVLSWQSGKYLGGRK